MNCPHARHALVEAVRPHLPLVPIDENRIDGHEADAAPHAQRCKKICLAQADDGDVDRAADFQKAGLLEMPDDERVVARTFRLQRGSDGLRGATEFRQRVKEMVGRIEAMNLEAEAVAGGRVEQALQPLDVRRLLDRMDKALIPKPVRTGRLSHRRPFQF